MSAAHPIDQLFRDHQRGLLALLTRLVHDQHVAEELCQDTFLKAWSVWETHRPHHNARAWLYRVACNTAYDYLRTRRSQPSLCSLDALPEFPTDQATLGWEDAIIDALPVRQALACVPTTLRAPLMLQAYVRAPVRIIAQALGCTPNTMQVRLRRGRSRLRAALAALN